MPLFCMQERQYNTSATVQANTYPVVGRVLTDSGGGDVLVVVIQRPMAGTIHDGSLEMMLHRRLEKEHDQRGDDSTVMDDSVLLGFLRSGKCQARLKIRVLSSLSSIDII